jgi:ATP-dependent DNA helicase RecG
MIPSKEDLRVEFKSDTRKLNDHDLILAAVCLANTEGGEIFLGVENDGTVTGLHPEHRDMSGLAALIANRTVPPLSVRASIIDVDGKSVAHVEVPRSIRLVASSNGTLQRRRLLANGMPECVPFLPHEFLTRESDLRQVDHSALPVTGATADALDPLERQRLRAAVERYGGDRSLLGLEDSALDGALGLTRGEGANRIPTVAGLLLIGREDAIREHLPTHEVAFQVLEGTDVRVNDFYRLPLVRLFERIDEQFRARVTERELQVGLFRVPVPTVDRRAFREAFVNALTHRDYTRPGAVHVRWQPDVLSISNPGGFVDGVTVKNLLVVEPRPRNPLLADAFKRIGLAERTGRGVDLIYQGLLRYGRPAPDFSGSDGTTVLVRLSCSEADLRFLAMVLAQEEKQRVGMPLDALLVLSKLRETRRVDAGEIATVVQKEGDSARAVLERLVEAGLIRAHGVKKGRTYTLSPKLYEQLGQSVDYVRQAGFDRIQQEQMVKTLVTQRGRVQRGEVAELCGLSARQAGSLLQAMVAEGALTLRGQRRGAFYELAQKV